MNSIFSRGCQLLRMVDRTSQANSYLWRVEGLHRSTQGRRVKVLSYKEAVELTSGNLMTFIEKNISQK